MPNGDNINGDWPTWRGKMTSEWESLKKQVEDNHEASTKQIEDLIKLIKETNDKVITEVAAIRESSSLAAIDYARHKASSETEIEVLQHTTEELEKETKQLDDKINGVTNRIFYFMGGFSVLTLMFGLFISYINADNSVAQNTKTPPAIVKTRETDKTQPFDLDEE